MTTPMSTNTAATIAKMLSKAVEDAAREEPRFPPNTPVWIRIDAPPRLAATGLGPKMWDYGTIVDWLPEHNAYLVFVNRQPNNPFAATPEDIRIPHPCRHPPAENRDIVASQ